MSSIAKRRHFRIKYPQHFRPEVTVDGVKHEVVDLSVSGIRMRWLSDVPLIVGCEVTISVVFKSGIFHTCVGKVIRYKADEVILKFKKLIPSKIIKGEADQLLTIFSEVPTDEY